MLNKSEISYLDSRGCEVRYFEFDLNRRLALGLFTLNAWQIKVSSHEKLFATRKRFDGPDDAVFLRHVFTEACGRLELGSVSVRRNRNYDLHVVGCAPLLELALGFDHVFHARVTELLNERFDPEERFHLGVESVRHELEVSVRRNERNSSVVLEPRQPNALVKLDVLELDCLVLCALEIRRSRESATSERTTPTAPRWPQLTSHAFEQDLIVQAESELRHSAQVDAHLDGADYFATHHAARGAHENIDRLDDVQEDLVLSVLHVLSSPRNGVGDSGRQLGLVNLVAFLRDVLLQNFAISRLRVA